MVSPHLGLASTSLTSKSIPFWGSQRAQPDGLQPRQASSSRHQSGHCGIMRQELGTGHQAMGWAAWGWRPGWPSAPPWEQAILRAQNWTWRESPLGGNKPLLGRALGTGACSQGLGRRGAGCLCHFRKGQWLERRQKRGR